jgi:hypothetical protein
MNKLIPAILIVLCAMPATAQVLIRQVLPDPAGTDNGGEAVELTNDGDTATDIGGWWLGTPSSAKDATIPANTTLAPGTAYLIADTGWSTLRDEPLWRDADHEEALTLANLNGSVTLHAANGTMMHTVRWDKAIPGTALLRTETGEYMEAVPDFFGPDAIEIPVDILPPLAIEILDDDNASLPGIQLYPSPGRTRNITIAVTASGPATILFLNQSKTIELGNTTFSLPYTTPPGAYTIEAVKDTLHASTNLTILPRAALSFTGNLHFKAAAGTASEPQTLTLHNIGNVPIDVGLAAMPFRGPTTLDGLLRYGEHVIRRNLTTAAQLSIGEARALRLTLEPPENTPPGTYNGRLIVRQLP